MANQVPTKTSLPKSFGLLILGIYFLIFTFTASPGQSGSGEVGITAHHVPWIRLIIPDEMVLEWAENSADRIEVLDRVPLLFGTSALLITVMLIGRAGLRGFKTICTSRLETSVLAFALGTTLLTLFAFLLGVLGGLRLWWAYLLPLGIAIGIELKADDGSLSWARLKSAIKSSFVINQLSWWLIAIPVALILAGAMLPPWEFDVREYHSQVPKEWFQSGAIEHLPHNSYSSMPLGAELISVVPMAWAQLFSESDAWWFGALIGKTFLSLYALFAGLAAWGLAVRLGDKSSGAIAAILTVTCPWIGYISMTGLNEVALTFFWLSALLVIERSGDEQKSWFRDTLLVGILAGAAGAVKYTGLVFVIVPVGVWLCFKFRQRLSVVMVAFSLGCVISFGPWLIKNMVQTNNPVYPLLGTVFESPQRTAKQVEQWDNAHQVPSDDSFVDGLSEFLWQGSLVSPLLIGTVLVTLILHPKRRKLWPYFAMLTYSLLVWWLATHHLQRFLVPLLPLLAVVGAVGMSSSLKEYPRWRAGVLIALVVYMFMYRGAGMETDARLLVRLETLRYGPALQESDTATFRVHRYLNQQLGNQGRVVLVGDAEPFDLNMHVDYNTCFDSCVFADWLEGLSPLQQRQTLVDRQIDFIYVSWEELDRYSGSYGYDERVNRDWIEQLIENKVLVPEQSVDIKLSSGQLFRVAH